MLLIELAIVVVAIVLFRKLGDLQKRIAVLEARLKEGGSPLATLPEPQAVMAAEPVPDAEPVPAAAPAEPVMSEPAAPDEVRTARAAPDQNQPLVMRRDRFGDLFRWLRDNWVYAIAAASLALAGVFFVQYGMEHGLLPPGLRVLFGLGFGLALVVAGEVLRRRHGDRGAHHLIPQVFSGAGIVSAFAAIVAGRLMYGLISAEVAFAAQMAIAALAVWLGWLNGPLLVAVGLIGAAASPLIVGGTSAPSPLLYAHYLLVAAAGLAVDAVRRWAWVSVLALVLAYGGSVLMAIGGAGDVEWILTLVVLAMMAVALPILRLIPDHPGPAFLTFALHKGKGGWPVFPVRLAFGATLGSALLLAGMTGAEPMAAMLAFAALAFLALALLFWAERAEGLSDLAILPGAAFVVGLAIAFDASPLVWEILQPPLPEAGPDLRLSLLLGLALAVSLGFAYRALRARTAPWAVVQALGAVLVAPVSALLMELLVVPSDVLGTYPWALHVMGLAGVMVLLALGFARRDGADKRRVAYATLSALSLIALSLFVLTSATALTLALAVLVVVAAGLDRRFALREMGLFLQAGVAVLSWRLFLDPGLGWALDGPLLQVILAFGATLGAYLLARRLLAGLTRPLTDAVLMTAALGTGAIFANVLIARAMDAWAPPDAGGHWEVVLQALPWAVLALSQYHRAGVAAPRWMVRLRLVLAGVSGLLALGGMAMALTVFNPLDRSFGNLVLGWPLINTLLPAYGLPGAALIWVAPHLRAGWVQRALRMAGMVLVAVYAALAIRHFWQGPDLTLSRGIEQPELYTYTLALLALGAGLLWRALALKSPLRRRLAMAVIALTVAKVFFIDISGLTGLTRVASFLGLGLALAGLAWLNRWAGAGMEDGPAAKDGAATAE